MAGEPKAFRSNRTRSPFILPPRANGLDRGGSHRGYHGELTEVPDRSATHSHFTEYRIMRHPGEEWFPRESPARRKGRSRRARRRPNPTALRFDLRSAQR
jgi:hypothetical protein